MPVPDRIKKKVLFILPVTKKIAGTGLTILSILTQIRTKAEWSFLFTPLQRDSVTRFFASGFFLKSVSPQPLITRIPLGPFQIFSKIPGDIRSSRIAAPVSLTAGTTFEPPLFWLDTNGTFKAAKSVCGNDRTGVR
jgi:hypothetical protein